MAPEVAAALAIATVVVAVLQLGATAVIAIVLQRSTSKLARVELSRTLREAWVTIDSLALGDHEALQIADSLLPKHPTHEPDDFARKRLFILTYLNPIATWHHGVIEGIYGSQTKANLEVVRGLLTEVLDDDDAYWVSQNHWHDESFRTLCTEIRTSIEAKAGTSP
jgi:hypothetical protein